MLKKRFMLRNMNRGLNQFSEQTNLLEEPHLQVLVLMRQPVFFVALFSAINLHVFRKAIFLSQFLLPR